MNKHSVIFLLLGILCACLPHVSFQPASVIVISAVCLAWRIAFITKLLPVMPKFIQLLIAAAALGIILHGEHYNLGRDSGISLLVAALAIKQIQPQDEFNFYFSVCLAYFVAATAFLYDQSLFTFFCVGHAVVFVSLALFANASVSNHNTNYRALARLLYYAAPLTLLLFFLTPDLKGPLWKLPNDAYEAQTGLSEQMSPGKISALMDNNEVVFRVKFQRMPENKVAFIDSLYWRGPVLGYFDGQTWQSLGDTLRSPELSKTALSSVYTAAQSKRSVDANKYSVTLEPHFNNWLFTLNTPDEVQERFYLTSEDELLSRTVVNQPLQYTLKMKSSGADYSAPLDRRYLRMPNLYGFKTKRLVARLQQDLDPRAPYDSQMVGKVLAYFAEQPFYYSKKPPLAQYDPVDEFIHKTKTGFCEHYASAFAFMMRAAGIPSRVVTGYLGGEYNAVGDYVIVRQSHAHAWTEVWLKGSGWVRVDPTAVIPPNRVKDSSIRDPYLLAGFLSWDSAAFSHLGAWLDNLSYRWYGFLANVLQAKHQDWLSWVLRGKNYVLVFLLAILSTWLVWRLLNREAGNSDPVLEVYNHYCAKLSRRGFMRSPYESACDYAGRVCAERPDLEPHVRSITRLYNQLRYGRNPSPAVYQQLQQEVRRFRP